MLGGGERARTGKFFLDDVVGISTYKWYRLTRDQDWRDCAFQCWTYVYVSNDAAWPQWHLSSFYAEQTRTLAGMGQHRHLVREHVFIFEYKAPRDDKPVDPNLRLLLH